jgi:sugar diacid utilization regulator
MPFTNKKHWANQSMPQLPTRETDTKEPDMMSPRQERSKNTLLLQTRDLVKLTKISQSYQRHHLDLNTKHIAIIIQQGDQTQKRPDLKAETLQQASTQENTEHTQTHAQTSSKHHRTCLTSGRRRTRSPAPNDGTGV